MPIGPIASARRRTAGPPTDPNFASVVLLCGFEGTDGSTTLVDESSHSQSLTAFGTAQIDTAQFKFGTSSYLQSSASTSAINLTTSADYHFGSNNFTIEAWVRFNSLTDERPIFCRWSSDAGFQKAYVFGYSLALGGLWFGFTGQVDAAFHFTSGAWSPSTNTWYHVAVTRSGSSFRLFVDGTQVGSTLTDSQPITSGTGIISQVGFYKDGTEERFDGWMDELRVTNGVARYTSNFTAPTAAFPRS